MFLKSHQYLLFLFFAGMSYKFVGFASAVSRSVLANQNSLCNQDTEHSWMMLGYKLTEFAFHT